jgi:hypothetical protein
LVEKNPNAFPKAQSLTAYLFPGSKPDSKSQKKLKAHHVGDFRIAARTTPGVSDSWLLNLYRTAPTNRKHSEDDFSEIACAATPILRSMGDVAVKCAVAKPRVMVPKLPGGDIAVRQ